MREGVAPRPAPAGARSAALSVSAVRYSTTPTSLSHEGTWDDVKVTAPELLHMHRQVAAKPRLSPSRAGALVGGSGGMPPQKIVEF